MRKEKKFPSGRSIDPSPKLFIGGAEVPVDAITELDAMEEEDDAV